MVHLDVHRLGLQLSNGQHCRVKASVKLCNRVVQAKAGLCKEAASKHNPSNRFTPIRQLHSNLLHMTQNMLQGTAPAATSDSRVNVSRLPELHVHRSVPHYIWVSSPCQLPQCMHGRGPAQQTAASAATSDSACLPHGAHKQYGVRLLTHKGNTRRGPASGYIEQTTCLSLNRRIYVQIVNGTFFIKHSNSRFTSFLVPATWCVCAIHLNLCLRQKQCRCIIHIGCHLGHAKSLSKAGVSPKLPQAKVRLDSDRPFA